MERGNVLVIGNSGVGKSTLINALLGEERAKTSWGSEGTTNKLEIYESEQIPFRIIDTMGFEPAFIKEYRAVNRVKKWSKDSAVKDGKEKQINVIWFCVEGTASKLFQQTIKNMSRATAMWESVPIIVVVTKSYSVPERDKNIEMIYNAFAKNDKYSKNLKKVIPVVAQTYQLNDSAFAEPEGITELIDATNELMPEGIKAAEKDTFKFKLSRKKALAQGVVGVAVTSGVATGAIPIPFSDALLLSPIELAEINALARIYEINKNENSKQLLNSIVEVGTVGAAAKLSINALKAIPVINVAASALNAVVAGCIVAAIGEGSIYVFEKIYLGEKDVSDIDWVTKVMESKLSEEVVEKVKIILEKIAKSDNTDDIVKSIPGMLLASSDVGTKSE